MDIYLSFNNNEDVLRLPILPPSFEVQGANNNNVVNINSIGDINMIGKMGLSMIRLESFFPAQEYPFAQYTNPPTPSECLKLIDKWRKSGKPIRLIITNTHSIWRVPLNRLIMPRRMGQGTCILQ